MRHSELALVIIKLKIKNDPCVVMIHHPKWDDWTLVGGHVESDEVNNWARAAVRECEEELLPLKFGEDFILLPLLDQPISWGPVPSKTARNEPTTYRAQLFAMRFLKEPSNCFSRLSKAELRVFRQSDVPRSDLLTHVDRALGGFDRVHLAWDAPLTASPV